MYLCENLGNEHTVYVIKEQCVGGAYVRKKFRSLTDKECEFF